MYLISINLHFILIKLSSKDFSILILQTELNFSMCSSDSKCSLLTTVVSHIYTYDRAQNILNFIQQLQKLGKPSMQQKYYFIHEM